MPPLVFDFADIASRLRRDDFYTPTPKAAAQTYSDHYQCRSCDNWFDSTHVREGAANCPICGTYNRCYFP